jgi:mono/diheme cytochrome c family protein
LHGDESLSEVDMIAVRTCVLLATALLCAVFAFAQTGGAPAAPAVPQRSVYSGQSMFKTYCATCHGPFGKGDGPFAKSLRKPPPDLTQLTNLNQGTFPTARVTQAIDGRDDARPHGPADMPVWGDAFSRTTHDSDPESVRLKIEALVGFIKSIQEKSAVN